MLLSELSKIVFIRSKDFANRNIFVKKNSWWNKVKFSKVKNGNFLFVDVQNFLLLIEISALPLTKKKLNCFFNIIFFSVVTFFFSKTFFDDVIVWVINNCFHTFERLFKQKHLCQSKILMKQSKWWKKNLFHLSEKKACFISQKKKTAPSLRKQKPACFISRKKKPASSLRKKKPAPSLRKKKLAWSLRKKKPASSLGKERPLFVFAGKNFCFFFFSYQLFVKLSFIRGLRMVFRAF